jgi:hypothetical protein
MQNIFDLFAEDLTATLIVFLILFAAIAYFFAREKSVAVFSGVILIALSLFYAPFIYLRKAVLGLADYSAKRKTEFVQTRQYLLNKLLLTFQALLVILSIAILATGFVSGWNQMIPSKQLREAISSTGEDLKRLKSELQEIEPAVEQMETAWSTRRDSLISVYNAERVHRGEKMIAQNIDLANRINARSDTAQQALIEIRNYYTQNEYLDGPSQYEPLITEAMNYIERQSLSEETKTLLLNYVDNWYAQMLSRFETRVLSESQLRFAVQVTYHVRQKRLDNLKETIPAQEKELAQFRTELGYNFGALGVQILYTILQFILFVWVVGLVIESLELAVDTAANVQKIQEHFKNQ